MSRKGVAERIGDVLAFAGIGDAVHQPVRQYSTGMRARLGLALALHVDADLLLVDETLAVGDQAFQERAVDRLRARCAEGAGVVFVAHDLSLIAEVSDRVVRLDHGRVVDDGPTEAVIERAGGTAPLRGTRQEATGVRVHQVEVEEPFVPEGGEVRFSTVVEVAAPAPNVRIEVSYRALLEKHPDRMTDDEVRELRFMSTVVQPAGGPLARPGWYLCSGAVERNAFRGRCFLFVTAVDEVEGDVVAETWHDLVVGARAGRHPIQVTFDPAWSS
jgi:ABC-type multidrug transport system ATPase subunit